MTTNNQQFLTRIDFHQPNSLPPNYFECEICHTSTTFICRNKDYKYMAEFMCTKPSCQRQPWFKCRICTNKNKAWKRAKDHRLTTETHRNRLEAFERLRTKEYLTLEARFLSPPKSSKASAILPDSNDEGADSPHTSTNLSDEESNVSNAFEWNSVESTGITEPVPLPQTVEEWKAQLIANSPQVEANELHSYIPSFVEQTPFSDYRRRPLNLEYYQSNLISPGRGPRFLTAHSILKSPGSVSLVSPKTALWCALLAKLSDRITITDQLLLVAILHHVQQEARQSSSPFPGKESGEVSQPLLALPVPRTYNELRNRFVSGRNSFTEVLPRPGPIQILDGGFVFVSIRSILQYHLANGLPLDPLVNLRYYGRSSLPALHGSSLRGIELLSFTVGGEGSKGLTQLPLNDFPTEVTIWSDGFDPSEKKDNRGSAHVLFVSIGTRQDEYHSGRNTYPVSLGPADGDLSVIAEKVAEELAELFVQSSSINVYFDAASQKELAIFLRVFCFLQDRPERCHWLCLAHGNGTYAARFGWAGDLSQKIVRELLPSCQECNTWRLKNHDPTINRKCEECFDWNFSNLFFECPKDFPKVFVETSNDSSLPSYAPRDPRHLVEGKWLLPFKRIKVCDLKCACESTFNMVCSNHWSKKEGKAYLETHGISPELIIKICVTAETNWNMKKEEPMPKLPATWNIPGIDIFHHIDVPMHLCFLGITKANFGDLVSGWLKGHRQSTSFLKKSQPVLDELRKLSLSWCQVQTKFGGFVSENWVAYCRICKYVHQLLIGLESNDVQYNDPEGLALSEYNLTQRREWLLAREIPGIEKKSVRAVVDAKFAEYLNLPEEDVLPGIVRPPVSKASLDDVTNMVVYWHVCMSRLMSLNQNPSEAQVSDIDRHIKLFLTSVEKLDSSRRVAQARNSEVSRKMKGNAPAKKKRKTTPPVVVPVWRRKPNFVGLLNVPDAIRHFGLIRVLTELDLKGEASIKHIKSKMNQGLSGNWAYNAMLGYYRERSFKNVVRDCLDCMDAKGQAVNDRDAMIEIAEKIVGEDDDSGPTKDDDALVRTKYKNYHKFRKKTDALESLDGSDPISGLVFRGRFYLMVEDSKICSVLQIEPTNWGGRVFGGDYFAWRKTSDWLDRSSTIRILNESREYFLLLPSLKDGSYFYAITSEWREMVKSGNQFVLKLPQIPGASY